MNVNIENFVGVFENAFSKEYCDEVIEYFNASIKAGFGVTRQQQGAPKSEKDDTQVYTHSELPIKYSGDIVPKFNETFWKHIYPVYSEKFDVLRQSAPHTTYAFKVQKTDVGQGYHVWHYEADSKANAQRILAWALYLNDVDEGGETEFLYYPKRIKPKAGTLILWPASFTHTHRGNPPLSNTKYIITGWIEF